jgi:hypothetical protein
MNRARKALNEYLVVALLAVSLGLTMFVFALRSQGQPMPPSLPVDTNSYPEFVRAVEWKRDTNVTQYLLTVNDVTYLLTAIGTNGQWQRVTNLGFVTGTNTITVTGLNSNVWGTPTLLKYHMERIQEDTLVWMTSTNLNDYMTGRGTPTNLPASGKFTVKKNQPMRFFWLWTSSTNYITEGPL